MAKYLQQCWCKEVNRQVKFADDMKLEGIIYSEGESGDFKECYIRKKMKWKKSYTWLTNSRTPILNMEAHQRKKTSDRIILGCSCNLRLTINYHYNAAMRKKMQCQDVSNDVLLKMGKYCAIVQGPPGPHLEQCVQVKPLNSSRYVGRRAMKMTIRMENLWCDRRVLLACLRQKKVEGNKTFKLRPCWHNKWIWTNKKQI